MEPVAIVTALLGIVSIVSRGGLLFAPEATLALQRRLFSNTGRTRLMGVFVIGLGVALIVTAHEPNPGQARFYLELLGWFVAVAGLGIVIAPGAWGRFALSILEAFEDPTTLRAMGALGIGFGVFLIWVAFSVL